MAYDLKQSTDIWLSVEIAENDCSDYSGRKCLERQSVAFLYLKFDVESSCFCFSFHLCYDCFHRKGVIDIRGQFVAVSNLKDLFGTTSTKLEELECLFVLARIITLHLI